MDVGFDEILFAPRADQRNDMTVDAASVGYDGRRQSARGLRIRALVLGEGRAVSLGPLTAN